MKKLLLLFTTLFSGLALTACGQRGSSQTTSASASDPTSSPSASKVLFINASQNKDGNTDQMGADLLEGIQYDQIDLIDYQIGFLGQDLEGDQFQELTDRIKEADTLVIGSPVYWHSMTGSLKTLIDRASEMTGDNPFAGKKLYFFMQGSAPTDLSKESTVYIIQRFVAQLDMVLKGTATDDQQLQELKTTLANDR